MKVTTALRLALKDNPPPKRVRVGASELARLLGISKQAVQNFGPDVPEKWEAVLRKTCPHWFKGKQ